MSQITTIHNALYAWIAAILTSHKELRNPRSIEANDTLYLAQGYAINIGPVVNTNRVFACKLSLKRELTVTNTLQVFATDRDVTTRKTVEKTLLEDQFLLISNIESNPTLTGVVNQINFLSDSGIQEVFNEEGSFLMIQSIFEFEYFESY